MNHFKLFILNKERRKMVNSRRCDICDVHVHRASSAKHLRSKKHIKNIKQDDMILPDWNLLKINIRKYTILNF